MVQWDSSSADCLAGKDQSKGNACGFAQASINKIVNANFADTWPGAMNFAKSYTLTNDVQNALIQKVDQEKRSVEEVAAEWIDANESVWGGWVK